MTSTGNPLERTAYADNPPVSSKTFPIAGILTHVLGLAELPTPCTSVSVLWLLHPRLQQAECMLPLGSLCINTWNRRQQQRGAGASTHGLLAVTFDQRNHGTRLVDAAANGSWRDGNERHAQDMFSVFHGTAVDVSLLIDHLGSYVFEDRAAPHPPIAQNLVLGISLGGHAAWQVLFAEPRVEAAVVIIGCPDYMRVMADRARLSKRKTWLADAGASFLGSADFPPALVSSVLKWDPRGVLFGLGEIPAQAPVLSAAARLQDVLDSRLGGKSVLVCSGGADKLVPYAAAKPFMEFLKGAVAKGGWWDGGMSIEDVVYPGVGHEMSDGMVRDSVRFVVDLVEGRGGANKEESRTRGSRI